VQIEKGGKREKMEKASISIFPIVLSGLVATVFTTSPMPDEVKPGQTDAMGDQVRFRRRLCNTQA